MKPSQSTSQKSILQNQAGMSLMEILIVIALIGVVMTLVGQNVIGKFNRAKVDTTKVQMRSLSNVLDDFRRECNFYPTTDQGLDALINKPTTGRECKNYDPEGYIKGKKVPEDGWGQPFLYESDGNKFTLKSLGADNAEGGEELNKDISSEDL